MPQEKMTEREMTEAAALAVGLTHQGEYTEFCGLKTNSGWFHPRVVSDDSMMLMAALRISVEHNHPADNHPWVSASVDGYSPTAERACFGFMEDVPDESQRADRMRLAILRCAAAQAPKEVA